MSKSDLINWGLLVSEAKAAVGNCQITHDQKTLVNCINAIDATNKYISENYEFSTLDKIRRIQMSTYFVALAKVANAPVSEVLALYSESSNTSSSVDFIKNEMQLTASQRSDFMCISPFLSAYYNWQFSKNVFVFDDAVLNSLQASALEMEDSTQKLPIEVLKRLPTACVVIPIMATPVFGDVIDDDVLNNAKEPSLIFAHFCSTSEDENENLYALNISFLTKTNGTLEIMSPLMSKMIDMSQGVQIHDLNSWIDAYFKLEENIAKKENNDTLLHCLEKRKENQKFLVNLTLQACFYLCSDEPDLSQPVTPETQPKKTKKGIRKFQAERVTQVDVGVRIGQAIRQNYVKHGYHEDGKVNAESSHKVRPHFRKAHWHTFKIGAMKREDGSKIPAHKRESRVRWIPPLVVNATLGEVDVVVKPVIG